MGARGRRAAATLLIIGGIGLLGTTSSLSAFESHLVNVVSHVQEPVVVEPDEVLVSVDEDARVSISLSDAFLEQTRVQGLEYRLVFDAAVPVRDASVETTGLPLVVRCIREPGEHAEPTDRPTAASLGESPGDVSDIWVFWLDATPAEADVSHEETSATPGSVGTSSIEPESAFASAPAGAEAPSPLSPVLVTVRVEVLSYIASISSPDSGDGS